MLGKENQRVIYSLFAVCCISSAIAITFDKSIEVASFDDMIKSMNSCMGIGPAVVFGMMMFFSVKNQDIYHTRRKKAITILAVILSQCYWVGYRLDYNLELFELQSGLILQWMIISLGWFFIIWTLSLFLFDTVDRLELIYEESVIKEKKRWAKTTFISCTCVWLLYYIAFFPGVVTNDSFWQISQALGFEKLSNHHPFMHTLLESLFLRPAYSFFNNTEVGIAAFLLFQLLIMSLIVSYAQLVLCELGVSKRLRTVMLLFYIVNPLFGMYSITMWKDVWMGMMLMLYLLLLIKILYFEDYTIKTYWFLALSVMGVFFSKATGVAMIFFSLIALLLVKIKGKKLPVTPIIIVTAALLLSIGIQSLTIHIFGVMPTESRESKSVPLQQIAYTVIVCGDKLSEDEKTSINEILPYDELIDRYNPRIADPVKNTFKENNFNKNKTKYIQLWVKLGKKYPSVYIKSFLLGTYGYWYPDTNYWVASSQSYGFFFTEEYTKATKDLHTSSDKYVNKYNTSKEYFDRRKKMLDMIFYIRSVPGTSLFFSIGAYFWLYSILAASAIREKNLEMMVPFSIVLAVFVSCLISPIYCEMRYGYPAVFILPVVVALCLRKEANTKVRP